MRDGKARDGVVVADDLDAPDGAVDSGEEHVGHDPSVAGASDTGSRESDIANVAFGEVLLRRSRSSGGALVLDRRGARRGASKLPPRPRRSIRRRAILGA